MLLFSDFNYPLSRCASLPSGMSHTVVGVVPVFTKYFYSDRGSNQKPNTKLTLILIYRFLCRQNQLKKEKDAALP
jgi:hypothetical protein